MLTTTTESEERITTAHRAKLAYVYIRQSSAGQVRQHQESTQLQYRLVGRAASLGWPRDRIEVIDDDLGKSGASSDARYGFQRLIAEIGLGKAGLVLSLDASRLARNNRDWHQLLELCSLFGALIADGERLYDPCVYHDRLLLGLSGIMSEAELHQIKVRLHQGERQKAARGELRMPLPAGLAYRPGGGIILNPDDEVQARLRLVFTKFQEQTSAKAVMRTLLRAGLPLPVRPLRGPAPHAIEWRAPSNSRVIQILKNPAYAGAYVYGRRRQDPSRRKPGVGHVPTVAVAVEDWSICLRDAFAGYIGWDEFMDNQKRLSGNLCRYQAGQHGVARKGSALLQGLAVCGRCGRRMGLRYSGPNANYPVYRCTFDHDQLGAPVCQEVRALPVDAEVERLVLEALEPDRIAMAITALAQVKEEVRQLERQWSLKKERAHYEAERARRQYDAVDPDNRLVARSLERQWEEKLREVEATELAFQRWRSQQSLDLGEDDREALLTMGEDMPKIWHAPTTTAADRKQMLRFLIQDVMLDQKREQGQVVIKIVWATGASSEHRLRRKVQAYDQYSGLADLERRVRELNGESKMDSEIAEVLNREEYKTTRGTPFSGELVHLLRQRWAIPTVKINGTQPNPAQWPDGSYSVQGLAVAMGVTTQTIFKYLRRGRLNGRQLKKGMPWQIDVAEKQIANLKGQVQRKSRSRMGAS
jgi:DNA invertase Pin-like site-specific DNA recombinase